MSVKRYEFVVSNSCECVFPNIIEESIDGDLVSYSDYLAVVARLKYAEKVIDAYCRGIDTGAHVCAAVYYRKYPNPVE